MYSHPFIGVGVISETLRDTFLDAERIAADISRFIHDSELQLISQNTINFENRKDLYLDPG
jgi:hypothetical protein